MIAFPGCGYQLPDIEETTRQTYEEYRASNRADFVDPRGASDISKCLAFEGDGYDEWWRFTVTQADFTKIVAAVAKSQHGPKELAFSNDGSIPGNWRADAEIPSWWVIPAHDDVNGASALGKLTGITAGFWHTIRNPKWRIYGIGITNGHQASAALNN